MELWVVIVASCGIIHPRPCPVPDYLVQGRPYYSREMCELNRSREVGERLGIDRTRRIEEAHCMRLEDWLKKLPVVEEPWSD